MLRNFNVQSAQDSRDNEQTGVATMAKFEIKKAKNDEYYFHLKAGNGETILASEMYVSKASAENGIESVKKNAPVATVDDQTAH
jgi:uncharacterized protein YegP (UPF0339 family)